MVGEKRSYDHDQLGDHLLVQKKECISEKFALFAMFELEWKGMGAFSGSRNGFVVWRKHS